jgi:hypothetical protein
MAARLLVGLALLLGLVIVTLWLPLVSAHAQTDREPTAREIAAIRTCATKYQDDVDEGEQHCMFKLVATPCTKRPKAKLHRVRLFAITSSE